MRFHTPASLHAVPAGLHVPVALDADSFQMCS